MNCKYLVAAAFLIGMASPLSAQSVKAGIEAWQRSDYAGAVAIWRPLAEKGDADAEFNLAQAYRLGRGVPTNLSAAKTWFERAASQGHVDAQTTLGLLLFQNGDQAEGLKWLKKAAEQGDPRALLVYGTALVNGDSVTQDPALGYAFVSRAAAQGLQPAKETLEQLDQILPIADRKRGATLARDLAKAAPGPKSAPATQPSKSIATATAKPPVKAPPKQVAASPPPPKPQPKKVAVAPTPKPTPAPAPAAIGNWRIQLGAFSQKGSAEELYRKLSGKAALTGRRAFYIPVGPITRLQVGPFESRAAAEAACRAAGVPCFAVPAK
ncbi:MAG TPA: SPOR domain-containing protein [Sphingomicrobium sp.]